MNFFNKRFWPMWCCWVGLVGFELGLHYPNGAYGILTVCFMQTIAWILALREKEKR